MRVRIQHPRIYLDVRGTTTGALLVEDGVVVATGADALRGHVDREEHPEGTCVMPGLIEAHIHLWGLGLRAGTVELRGARDTAEVYHRLSTATPVEGWVFGKNWDQNNWTDARGLSRDELDRRFPNTPLCLRRVDGHAYWVNGAALRQAGIDDNWQPPYGGEAWRDQTGHLSGCLVDEAMRAIDAVLPPVTEADDLATYRESAAMLHRFGITSAHKAWMPLDRLTMLENLRDTEELGLRLHLLFDCNDPNLDELLERGPFADRWISGRGIKFFADGAMGSQGAALLDPYLGSSQAGLSVETPETMNRRIPELSARGWQVAVHAIGDRGARNVLDAFERIAPADRARTRPRLEHAQMLHDDDVARFGELGVIASIQPIHLHSDTPWAHEVLSEEQLLRLFRWRDLANVTVLAGGSDFPIDDPNPWHGIAVSSTRRHARGQVFHVEQSLRRTEALGLYADGAAWAGFAENWLGQLHVGFAGDFCVLEQDPFRASDDEIWENKCLATFVAGRPVFQL